MAKYFDPRAVLRQTAKALLREFFRRRGELLDVPWDDLDAKSYVPVVYDAWQRLPDDSRRAVQVTLRELSELSDERGVQAFAAEIQARAPDQAWQFTACRSRLNKALWFYLNFQEAYNQASLFARADALSTGRYAIRRNGLPKKRLKVNEEMTKTLEDALHEHYWPNELRGERCRVSHYTRPGGSEYFFAYLDDWPDTYLAFGNNGEMEPRIERYLFSVVFVCCPEEGSLELVAKGGPEVRYELQKAFCKAAYPGLEIEPADPLLPNYCLQRVLDPDFTYPTEPTECIGRVRLSRIGLVLPPGTSGVTHLDLTLDPDLSRREWLEVIFRNLKANGVSPSDVLVRRATFQLLFVKNGWERAHTTTFTITLPSSCDLKEKPDEFRLIGERCVRRWEFVNV